jgi:hemerythrin
MAEVLEAPRETSTVLFEWSKSMEIGIDEIDDQHQELVVLLNRLFVSMVQREREKATIEILDALIDYTKTHFTLEEQLMRDAKYEAQEYALHQRAHRDFIEKVDAAARKSLVEGKSVSFEMIHFLKHWLREHILVSDRQFADAVLRAGYVPARRPPVMPSMTPAGEVPRPWWKLW